MQESKTNLITLVDGSFLLYQGYYAMPPLTNRLGEPTGALHNFLLQLERISTVTDPSHMAVLFDSATASSARKRSLPAYKQNRFCPDDLRIQFAKAKEALNELGYRWMCSETHEADDLIATCVRAQPEDRFVKIASKDKDLLQLVNKKVNLIAVDPDGEHWRITGETEVMRRWGVRPDQMGYLLALMGDAVDVIPGVPGIGQMKGAALLQRFENLEGILRAAQDCTILGVAGISEKLRLNILKYGDRVLELYEKVVQLQDVPLEEDLLNLKVPQRDEAWKRRVEAYCEKEAFEAVKKRFLDKRGLESSGPQRQQENGGILVISTVAEAERVIESLRSFSGCLAVWLEVDSHKRPCYLSIYGGPKLELGDGKKKVVVDFRESFDEMVHLWCNFLAEPSFKKVYHRFSELRWHMERARTSQDKSGGDLAAGLQGDTMHMARLLDPSLTDIGTAEAYSIPWLAQHFLDKTWRSLESLSAAPTAEEQIEYNADYAAAIFHLFGTFQERLKSNPWELDAAATPEGPGASMWDFYCTHWQQLPRLLSDVELRGVPVNEKRLAEVIEKSEHLLQKCQEDFCHWAAAWVERRCGAKVCLDAMNLNSLEHLRQLLFEPVGSMKEFDGLPLRIQQEPWIPLDRSDLIYKKKPELELLCREKGCKVTGKKMELIARLSGPEDPRVLKVQKRKIQIPGLGMPHTRKTPQGLPQVTVTAVEELAKKVKEGEPTAQKTLDAFLRWKETNLELRFLRPLQTASQVLNDGRIHSELNLNTMTGRLSTRNPNLQGEPTASPNDVRALISAQPGRRLLIADYGQLELRLVAHLANCQPMIDILKSGGDIHSQTAYKMFEDVHQAVDRGHVRLDEQVVESAGTKDASKEVEAVPTVKEHFVELRKKAKTLNFSLLYGKTAFSLAEEWNVTEKEAQVVIDSWFDAFPEVHQWLKKAQEEVRGGGQDTGSEAKTLATLLGRRRALRGKRPKALRVAGNTPVQGSAADVVLSAMLRCDEVLPALGFHLVLQIHDELIFEGPEDLADEAFEHLIRIMENPLPFKLKVPLSVSARQAQSWRQGPG